VFDWFFEMESCFRLLQSCAEAAVPSSSSVANGWTKPLQGLYTSSAPHIRYVIISFNRRNYDRY
jgi:hypothetical protein